MEPCRHSTVAYLPSIRHKRRTVPRSTVGHSPLHHAATHRNLFATSLYFISISLALSAFVGVALFFSFPSIILFYFFDINIFLSLDSTSLSLDSISLFFSVFFSLCSFTRSFVLSCSLTPSPPLAHSLRLVPSSCFFFLLGFSLCHSVLPPPPDFARRY